MQSAGTQYILQKLLLLSSEHRAGVDPKSSLRICSEQLVPAFSHWPDQNILSPWVAFHPRVRARRSERSMASGWDGQLHSVGAIWPDTQSPLALTLSLRNIPGRALPAQSQPPGHLFSLYCWIYSPGEEKSTRLISNAEGGVGGRLC